MVDIRRCTVDEIEAAPNLASLIAAYELECGMPELGKYEPQFPIYRLLQDGGCFHPICAFVDGCLVGFILPLVIINPHSGMVIASAESFFVMPESRAGNTGLLLLDAAEKLAEEKGAAGLFISALIGSPLASVLAARKSYRANNIVFVKVLK